MAKQVAKTARIGGSSNEELDDGSKELTSTARVGFSSEKFQVKPQQPVEINDKLVGGMMAKLIVATEGQTRTEKWEVGRLKSHKKINVALPQGGVTVAAFLYGWQALDSGPGAPLPECSAGPLVGLGWLSLAVVPKASEPWLSESLLSCPKEAPAARRKRRKCPGFLP